MSDTPDSPTDQTIKRQTESPDTPAAAAPTSKQREPGANGTRRRARNEPPEEASAGNAAPGMQGLYEGMAYCLSRPSVLGLILLEAASWVIGTAFFLFLLFHAERVLELQSNDAMRFLGRTLECVGIGLVGGAFFMSKVCRKVSPILSCTPAFILIAYGLNGVLHSTAAAGWNYPAMFALGFGGGLAGARIGPDLRAMVAPEFHGRIFSLRTIILAAAILMTLFAEALLSAALFEEIVLWIPTLLYFALPLVFALSWIADISIHTRNETADIREFPGPLHVLGYRALRAIARVVFKRLFRYEPVDARNVPESGGVVIAANHGSFIDPILLSCGTDRLIQYVIYSTYYRSLAHPLFRFLRCIPVDENDQLGALRTGVRSLKLGACIGIFPEGEVSADGKLHPPMRGALFLAQRSGASVVPAALKGDYQALPRGAWIPRPAKVTPIFGKPFAVGKDLSKKDTEALTDQLMAELARKLGTEPPPKIA